MNIENGQSAAEQILTKPIKGWEDKYTISSDGKVYSIRSGKFLKPRLSMDGYERVALCDGPIRREYRIHRLVAEAFVENPQNLPQINHKDFNKLNNYVTNLEWCDDYYNTHYSINSGRSGFGNQKSVRGTDGQFKSCKAYTFTNVYNNKQFTIIGLNNIAKQIGCSLKNIKAVLGKYANTGMYVKHGYLKGLKVDSEYLEVHRLTPNHGVGSSDPKYRGSSYEDRDIVSSVSKDTAVSVTSNTDDAELTTPREQ